MEAGGRERDLRSAQTLAILTVAWNVAECGIGVTAGLAADSVVLLGYSVDSLIEATSAAVVGLRLRQELLGLAGADLRALERRSARIAGALLVALALFIAAESARRLLGAGPQPRESVTGIVLTLVAALAMPILGRRKLQLARRLGSEAVRIEAQQTIACAFFSISTLAGLVLNAALGWWWADPLVALTLVPWMLREGSEPWRSE